jgi:Tfp pilus assembly protein PilF
LKKAIELQPDFAGAHTTLAAVLRQQGDSAAAAAESKLGAEITRQQMTQQAATFATNSGMKLMNAGDLDGAIAQFESAVNHDPNYVPAHQQLAVALERKGEKNRAKQEMETAQQLTVKTAPSH